MRWISPSLALLVVAAPGLAPAAVPELLTPPESLLDIVVVPTREAKAIRADRKAAEGAEKAAATRIEIAAEHLAATEAAVAVAKAEIDSLEAQLKLVKRKGDKARQKGLKAEIAQSEAEQATLERLVDVREAEIAWAEADVKAHARAAELARAEAELGDRRAALAKLVEAPADPKVAREIAELREDAWRDERKVLDMADKHADARIDAAKALERVLRARKALHAQQRKLFEARSSPL